MWPAGVITLSFMLTAALAAPVNVHQETMTLYLNEDFHILLPSMNFEVTFRNSSAPRMGEVDLMRGGVVTSTRAKLNQQLSHLIIDSVGEVDEGVYTVKDPNNPENVKRINLVVRDCTHEQIIMYGSNFEIPLLGVDLPIMVEYRPSAVEANHTSRPALVLLTSTGLAREGYHGRISNTGQHAVLSGVTGADEGSYTIRDIEGNIRKKTCLNVKEHQTFVKLPYGKRLKISLILNSSLVHLFYTRDQEQTQHLLMDKGEFTNAREELGFGDRLSMEGSLVFLDQVTHADIGVFKITDILGFPVSNVHLGLEPYKLESLYVAIIALLGLLVFLLLVCLLSCLIKVKKRANRAAALEKIAQNAGKEDEGEAFRQVVKNITKLSEESKHSQADNTEKSQSTEVDIKGLEVSSKEVGIGNLETSDSGVGFNTNLPLDTDTDVPDQIPESEAVSISVSADAKPSPPAAAETKPSAPPALEIQPSPAAEIKVSPAVETKKTPEQPAKLDVSKAPDVKLSPAASPDPKAGLSPAEPKPAASPGLEPKATTPKATTPKATTPTPETKSALTPTPEAPKPTTPEPITNGTAEPGPDPADLIEDAAPKAAPPKTPEVELKTDAKVEANNDGAVAEDSSTAAATTT